MTGRRMRLGSWIIADVAAGNGPGSASVPVLDASGLESNYPASDFAALIYNAPGDAIAPQPSAACDSLAQQNIRNVYVGT